MSAHILLLCDKQPCAREYHADSAGLGAALVLAERAGWKSWDVSNEDGGTDRYHYCPDHFHDERHEQWVRS